MGRGPAPVEETRAGQEQGARADGRGAARRGGGAAYPVDRLRVLQERPRAEAARDEQEVDAGRVGEGVARHEDDAARGGDGLRRLRHREDVEEGAVLGAARLDARLEPGAGEHLERARHVEQGHAVEEQHADVPPVHGSPT